MRGVGFSTTWIAVTVQFVLNNIYYRISENSSEVINALRRTTDIAPSINTNIRIKV
jgi:hypothetical protein